MICLCVDRPTHSPTHHPNPPQWFRRRRRRASARRGNGANGGSSGSSQSNGGNKLAQARGLATSLIPRLVPNLPIRIAESLLGRTASVLVVIPAHFMGGIMGVAIARLLFAVTGLTHLEPPTQVRNFGIGGRGGLNNLLTFLTSHIEYPGAPPRHLRVGGAAGVADVLQRNPGDGRLRAGLPRPPRGAGRQPPPRLVGLARAPAPPSLPAAGPR